MRNKSKITTLESKFPLLSIEQGCMVSKDADITVAFRVELPELFTVTSTEYEAMHSAWHKAIKVLPNYSIVHKQDWFIKEDYQGKLSDGGLSFLARASERHFNERPYLHHSVYLFLTKTNKQRMTQQSNFSSLCRGHLLPKEITNKDEVMKFMEAVDQFERIINDTEQIRLTRMTEEELVGTKEKGGLLDRYFSLSEEGHASLEDIRLGADLVRVGDNMLCLHTLSDTDDLPTTVSTDSRYERLSTDRSDCRLSFASPVGLMLPCNHIYNQYLFIEDSDTNLERFEKQARNMHSLARYSRSNQINEEWIQEYLNIAHSQGLTSIRAHFNVLAWSSDKEELRQIKNDVGSALALMECHPRHNTIDAATLYWAGIPGNAADFPAEESFYTFIEEAWKAIASANMADYIKYLYKTVRKYFGEAIVVTQEVDDIIQSPIVKESIINNSDCKILLDQRKYMTKFDGIQAMLGLSEKEKSQILSINQNNDPNRLYKEVWIGLGGMQSAVYATEVSMEEYLTYTTEETEKVEVMNRAAQLGGDIETAIRQLAQEKRVARNR